jgi:threonine synthase
LETGNYEVHKAVATVSNAMDVGNPSNFVRIQEMYNNDLNEFSKDFSSYSFSDEETKIEMQNIFSNTSYIAEPHGAVGYLGLKKELATNPDSIGVFLETAHPIKFLDIVEPVLNIKLEIPKQIESVLGKEKIKLKIKNYSDLKQYLSK